MTGLHARPTFALPVVALNNRQSVLGLDLGLDWAALVFVIQHTLIPLPTFPRLLCRSHLANSSQQGLLQKWFCLK